MNLAVDNKMSPIRGKGEKLPDSMRWEIVSVQEYDIEAAAYLFYLRRPDGGLYLEPLTGKPREFEYQEATYFIAFLKTKDRRLKTDILDNYSHLDLTAIMQVVAPGANGRQHYHRLDPDCFTIVVNKAVEIPGIRKDLWLVADSNAHVYKDAQCGWFKYGLDNHYDIACFDSGFLLRNYPDVPQTFECGPLYSLEHVMPLPGCLRGGCTISSQAIQAAFWFGARHIRLIGVDMQFNRYFDGSSTGVDKRDKATWGWCNPAMQNMINWLIEDKGIRITTLSETALDVEAE